MINLAEGDYTCRAFFPRSLSAVHVETLMRIILQSFVTPLEDPPTKPENIYVAERTLKKLAENTNVAKSGRKRNLLSEWIGQDLSFYTAKKGPFLLPYTTRVGGLRWKAGKGQEGYDKVFQALIRAGRKEASKPLNKVSEKFIEIFDAQGGGVASDLLGAALRDIEKNKESFEEPEIYQDNILCRPHAILFQQDIELLTRWRIPRGHQIKLFKYLISYHFCAYLVRMAKAADWTAQSIARKLDSPQAYASVIMPCISCPENNEEEIYRLDELAANCKFHPCFSVGGTPSQEWHEVLARYHRNVALINLTLRFAGLPNRSEAKPENIFDLLDRISSDSSLAQKIVVDFEDIIQIETREPSKFLEHIIGERFNSDRPPKGHAWDFFNRFAPSKEAGFMKRHRRGRMSAKISPNLMNAWSHIFCAHRENNLQSPLLVKFIEFLSARGVNFVSDGLEYTESQLRSLGILRQYADMGVARLIEPIFPWLNSKD